MSKMEEGNAIAALTTVDIPEEHYTITRRKDGKPQEIEIILRGLTHDEALALQEYSKQKDTDNAMYEQRMLRHAMVWPQMSVSQIKAWQKSSVAGELMDILSVVRRLSGMDEDSAKNAYKSVSEQPVSGE